VTAVYGIEAKW